MKNGLDHKDYGLLTTADRALIEAKSRANRLGFTVLLVFFRDLGRFPRNVSEIDGNWIKELATRFNLEGVLDYATIINGRTAERYRAEIRLRFGFREATVNDADILTDWLRDHAVADAFGDFEKIVAIFELRCRELAIELASADRIERIVRASINAHDEKFYSHIYGRLSPIRCNELDNLLRSNQEVIDQTTEEKAINTSAVILQLRNNPGRPKLYPTAH